MQDYQSRALMVSNAEFNPCVSPCVCVKVFLFVYPYWETHRVGVSCATRNTWRRTNQSRKEKWSDKRKEKDEGIIENICDF